MGKLSLKAVLRNFLNHFETLESRRKCNSDDDLYLKEFQSMKELTESLKNDVHYSCSHGLKEVNRRKNRYKDILPYDYSRVILSEYPGVPGSDYINANYIRGSTGSSCAYIASQGPLPNTVVDYWRMIWETEVSVIVMACNETESGKYKCECYWPESSEQEHQYGNITVRIVKWRQVCPDFLVRTFKITCDSKSRRVCQFHYTTWPDHGVPSTVHPILELVRLMRDCESRETRPILVHCSAGCGRTGTICSIDFVWALLRTGRLTEDFSLFNIISDMRRQRIAMVQTQEQYMLCYRAVAALFEQQLKLIDAHTYENLDEDGEPLMLSRMLESGGSLPTNGDDVRSASEDTTESESRNEEEESDISPTKDVQHLVGAWHLDTIRKSNVDISSSSQPSKSSDVKHEKLVGKATVIRRPSIAKLKALFENRQPFEPLCNEFSPYERRSKIKLQRSYSTRERGSNGISSDDLTFRMNTSISEPKKLAAKFAYERKQQQNMSDCAFNDGPHRQEQQIHGFSFPDHKAFDKPWSSQHSSYSLQSEDIATNGDFQWGTAISNNCQSENYHSDVTDSRAPTDHEFQMDVPSAESAPPKPPRTFQYNSETRGSDEDSPCESDAQYTNGGRIIVSVALPRDRERSKENTYDYLKNKCPPCQNQEPNYYDIPSSRTARNASESNIYEPQTVRHVPKVRKELSKSTQGLAINEPIYYEPAAERNAAFQNFHNLGPKNLRRDMSVPALSAPQNFAPNKFVPKANVGNGIALLRHPNPKFVQCDQNRQQTAVFPQHPHPPRGWNVYGYPVPIVQPQANNTNNKPVALNATTVPKQEKATNPSSESQNKFEKKLKEKASKESSDDKKGAIPHENEKQRKKQGHSLASFFNFGKKKKEKLKPSASVPQTQPAPTVSNTVTVRPPHSHRFLPPTQWTQV